MFDLHYTLRPSVGIAFPSWAFGITAGSETVTVTHHYLDKRRGTENGKVLRRRTDKLSLDTARKLFAALQQVGYTQTND